SQVAPQDGPTGRFLQMSDAELAAELEKLIRELGGVPSAELITLYLEVLRADLETNKRYVMPDPFRLPCRITAIGWTADSEVSYHAMGGWRECGELAFHLLQGRHYRFLDAPPELLGILADGLGAG